MPRRDELHQDAASYRLLRHPFYQAWASGALLRTDIFFYASQYWRQVVAFPGYLAVIADRLPVSDVAHRHLVSNLADEIERDLDSLWLNFTAALGGTRDLITSTAPEQETSDCITRFEDAAGTAPVPFALGMLYGYESQTPEVARAKIEGLKTHYGIDGPALGYFEVHASLAVGHSTELEKAIHDVVRDDASMLMAKTGVKAGASAIWHLLDGVCRARCIA